jgi:hypothetical protein
VFHNLRAKPRRSRCASARAELADHRQGADDQRLIIGVLALFCGAFAMAHFEMSAMTISVPRAP